MALTLGHLRQHIFLITMITVTRGILSNEEMLSSHIMAHCEARCPAIQITKTNIETRDSNKNKAKRFLVYFPISTSSRVLMRPLLTHQS